MQTADIQPDEGGESSAAAAFAAAAAFIYGTRYKTAGQVTRGRKLHMEIYYLYNMLIFTFCEETS